MAQPVDGPNCADEMTLWMAETVDGPNCADEMTELVDGPTCGWPNLWMARTVLMR